MKKLNRCMVCFAADIPDSLNAHPALVSMIVDLCEDVGASTVAAGFCAMHQATYHAARGKGCSVPESMLDDVEQPS